MLSLHNGYTESKSGACIQQPNGQDGHAILRVYEVLPSGARKDVGVAKVRVVCVCVCVCVFCRDDRKSVCHAKVLPRIAYVSGHMYACEVKFVSKVTSMHAWVCLCAQDHMHSTAMYVYVQNDKFKYP